MSEKDQRILEERKVVALEKIVTILDSLTIWFEEVDKDEWSNRVQYYLAEFYKKYVDDTPPVEEEK